MPRPAAISAPSPIGSHGMLWPPVEAVFSPLDHLFGGTGNDTLLTRGVEVDFANCGPGRDSYTRDRLDHDINCERQLPSPAARRQQS
jgi:hypothetical protein